MIVNLPTSDNMNGLALRLYFNAWSDLLGMEYQFDEVFEPGMDWSQERTEYLVSCQPELQTIYTIIQQSNELALKARICEVSPYSLLLNSNPNFSTTPKDVDFATLRTLDAVDLPGAVNSICAKTLNDKFVTSYHQIRSRRNQITHLGAINEEFLPKELLHLLVAQYLELWADRNWLQDRVAFAARTTSAFFHDGRYGSAHAVVMYELEHTFDTFTGAEFKGLFDRNKTTRRYICHTCIYEATLKIFVPDKNVCKTAYLEGDSALLHCIMCGQTTPVTREKCKSTGCTGDVIATGGDFDKMCHSCGEHQDEVAGNSDSP
jgi:hypothetical protein